MKLDSIFHAVERELTLQLNANTSNATVLKHDRLCTSLALKETQLIQLKIFCLLFRRALETKLKLLLLLFGN